MVDQEIRPPTPPRASSSAIGDASLSADDSIPIVAPTTAFSPSDASPLPLSSSRSKRVNFSPMASYIKPPEFTDHSMKPPTRLRSLPPSSNQSVPAKSILKSRTMISDNIPSDELRSSPSTDLSGMLSSIIEQLSGSSHILRRDAYSQLVGSLSAYCDQPDSNSIIDNIDLFVGWIKRDINTTPSSNDDSDYSLPHQALNLLNMLVFKPEISPRIPDDFKAYILDRAISSIQQNSTPKNIVIDYMRLLSIQNFSPKILTSSRATKLLETISNGPDRVGGKAVTALRLNIYDRLFSQARSIFVSHANFWMDNLIAGLLHKVKDVRLKALQLGFRITDSLGPSTPVFKAIDEVLNLPTDKGKDTKFVNDFCDRLTSMIANRETSLHVPQIWSVVTLLLRSPRWQIEKWSHFKAWMLVIQKCFNCSDLTTNSQALLAWNRLVYVVQQSSESNRGMAKFLFKPIDSQLERRKTSKRGAHTDHAFSSYCNLLYYSFKPGTPFERLDLHWTDTSIEDSTAGLAWVHLSRSLADASSKEIQPSTETMEAVGSILESLQRIWKKTGISAVSRAKDGNSIFFNQFLFFVKTIVHSFGSNPYPPPPPPQRCHQNSPLTPSPIFSIPRYKSLLHGIIETGIQSRTSRSSRLEILRQFTESLLGPTSEALELNHDSVEEVWKSISAFTKETLATSTPDTNVMGKDETSTRDYDKVLAILERGTRYNIKSLEWSSLFRSLMTVVRNEKGDAQVSQFIESFVSHSIRNGISIGFGEMGLFMEAVSFPREPATRAQPINLPATTKTSPKPQPFCEKVVSLTNDILLHLYHAQSWECIPDVLTFIDAVSQWLERCPEHYRITLLERLQIGIVPWLSDPSEKLTAESGIDKSILNSARTMTSVTICNITSLRTTNSETLEQLASLMTAGFESRHKSIVNKFISMWNASFGLEKNLSYPASLEAILRRLKPFVEIQLPGFPERTEPESIFVPEYLSSQEDVVTPKPVQRPKKDGSERSSSSPDSNTRSRKRKSEQKHDATTPKRPRHDDSQIQFVTVEPEGEMAGPLESQFMTENQKSVRERQRKDAAIMFPEMHSARPSSRCKTLDPLDSNLPTPTIPPEAPNAVEEVQSSPTPASRSPRTSYTNLDLTSFPSNVEWSFSTNGDPPSSPPQTVPSSQGEPAAHELSCTSPHNAQSSSTKEPSQLTHNNEDEDADSTPRPNSRSKATVQADPGKEDELVPDSFNDPLQEQIASQLEQDLELSMDLSVPEDKPSKTKKKLGSRRRKRNDNSSNSSNSEPARVPTIEVAIEAKLPEPTHTVSDTTSSTTKKPSGSQRRSGRKRSSPSMEEETSQETQGSVESSQPAPKKRRSLRLRGRAIADKEIEAKSDDVVELERERSEAAASLPDQATEAKGNTETEGARIEPERSDTPPPPESQAREQVSPGSSILQSLKAILGSLRNVSFGRSTLRELDDVMFDIKMEAHNAFKRSE
ncbi:telomere length regulator protein [Trichophyton equinum CBS 127.97]|uniref:Telomere length regulator protein n=1 Tax=Trichophyton equinum (strain ATCC MYA-4606 / CBS 127.97) TaxID=559882 RepID=F2Q192_TRIEC|nr:telomere length regulator protein [Trichophyton equinum CBS 127.97]